MNQAPQDKTAAAPQSSPSVSASSDQFEQAVEMMELDEFFRLDQTVLPGPSPRAYCEDLGAKGANPFFFDQLGKLGLPIEIVNGLLAPRITPATVLALYNHTKDWRGVMELLIDFRMFDAHKHLRNAYRFVHEPELMALQLRYWVLKHGPKGKPVVCDLSFDGRLQTKSFQSFREAECDRLVTVAAGNVVKQVAATDIWLKDKGKHQYEVARFMPGRVAPKGVYNLWQGWPYGYQNGVPRMIREHIYRYLCGGEADVYNWVLGWLADMVQNIDKKGATALVMTGPQGSGKNVFFDLMSQLIGEAYCLHLTQSSHLVGNFSAQLEDKLLVFANEAFFAKNKKEANALKSLVTDKKTTRERKGVDAEAGDNWFRLIIASNEEHVVDLELSDRRYCVLRADAQEHNNDPEYFAELIEAWENRGEREMFLKLLLDTPLDGWDPSNIPETDARMEQRRLSLPDAARDVEAWLAEGEATVLDQRADEMVLVRAVEGWTKSQGKYMRDAVCAERGPKTRVEGDRCATWWVPELREARKNFAVKMQVRPSWLDCSDACWDGDRITDPLFGSKETDGNQ